MFIACVCHYERFTFDSILLQYIRDTLSVITESQLLLNICFSFHFDTNLLFFYFNFNFGINANWVCDSERSMRGWGVLNALQFSGLHFPRCSYVLGRAYVCHAHDWTHVEHISRMLRTESAVEETQQQQNVEKLKETMQKRERKA